MKDFKGKVAVITGAASGMGLGMAQRFAAEGAAVVMTDVEQAALDRAAQGIAASGGRVLAVPADVSDADAVAGVAKRAVEAFGKVHVLCANAGVVRQGAAWEHSLDDWKWVLGVNLWGVVHCLRAFMPLMLEHGEEGHVVITASAAGLTASSSSSYTASKFAVVGLAEGLKEEVDSLYGGKIGVSVLCPGGVKTGIFSSERNRPTDLGQVGRMRPEVAQAMAVLAAPNRTDQVAPEFIANLVLQAVRDRQFYILPMQTHFMNSIRGRAERLVGALQSAPVTGP